MRKRENNTDPGRKVEGSRVGTKQNKSRSDYNKNKKFIIELIDTVRNKIIESKYIY